MKSFLQKTTAMAATNYKAIYLSIFIGLLLVLAPAKSKAQTIDSSWVKYADSSGVVIYYEFTNCSGNNVAFVNFSNTNSYDVKIEWQDSIQTAGMWVNASKDSTKALILSNGATSAYDCSTTSAKQCIMFSKDWVSWPNPKITGYKIATLKITKQ
jgi:hypothetical protein